MPILHRRSGQLILLATLESHSASTKSYMASSVSSTTRLMCSGHGTKGRSCKWPMSRHSELLEKSHTRLSRSNQEVIADQDNNTHSIRLQIIFRRQRRAGHTDGGLCRDARIVDGLT